MAVDAPAATPDAESADPPPPPMPLPQITTIEDEPAVLPPNPPPVNLIFATPENSQETAAVGTIPLVPTPPQPAPVPPPAPIFASVHAPVDMDEVPTDSAAAAAVASAASSSAAAAMVSAAAPPAISSPDVSSRPALLPAPLPQPRLPRSRSRTPKPALLAAPTADGMRTRSQTRSPSPTPVAGTKRPADDKSEGDGAKKRKT